MITGEYNYSDPMVQYEVDKLTRRLENTSYISNSLYTESWLRTFVDYVSRNNDYLNVTIDNEVDFIHNLKEVSILIENPPTRACKHLLLMMIKIANCIHTICLMVMTHLNTGYFHIMMIGMICLQLWLFPANPFSLDVKFNEDGDKIVASRFLIQAVNISGTNHEKEMVKVLRDVVAQSPLNASVFHPYFVFFDQVCMQFSQISITIYRLFVVEDLF